jgi:hypothetical protein
MPKKADQDDEPPPWQRYRAQEISCPLCGNKFVPKPPNAKTCPDPECRKQWELNWRREHYHKNSERIIAQQCAGKRRRHQPAFKQCEAPHPTIPGALCGKEFEVKTVGDGRRLTCSKDCSVRRRWALQRKRYHDDPQAKRDYKNAYYATNYAQPVGTTRCPNPACGREYPKKKVNQHTCGRPVCHLWKYGIFHREEINARKRKKRRENRDTYNAYQRDYRARNPDKFNNPQQREKRRERRAKAPPLQR